MVSIHPLISKSSSPFINPLVTLLRVPWYKRHFHVPHFFLIPLQDQSIDLSFPFLSILLCGQPGQQNPQFCKFSFALSGRLAEIK